MTTHIPMARVPFAPLDSPRLQHLASAKNRQMGALAAKPSSIFKGKATVTNVQTAKRSYEISVSGECDSENMDPSVFSSPSKKPKSQPFTFSLSNGQSMPPPSTVPARVFTPLRTSSSSSKMPLTAPAGRSPKRKTSAFGGNRRLSAPFKRIDPPFASRTNMAPPFSLDAALKGTFAQPEAPIAPPTIQESMPKAWFFDVYEDTPEEEAANLMEHSTLRLDLSSDEENTKKRKFDMGKENTPPEGYDAPHASRSIVEFRVNVPRLVKKTEIIRKKKVVTEAMVDDLRSPLSDLETDSFIPEGLDKDSHVMVMPSPEKGALEFDLANLNDIPALFIAGKDAMPAKDNAPDAAVPEQLAKSDTPAKDDIVVWEDHADATHEEHA